MIWFIGEHMIEGYLPLCKHDSDYHVDVTSLKAIKCDDAQEIMRYVVSARTKTEYNKRFDEIKKRFNK